MITFKATIKKDKIRRDKTWLVLIRVTLNKKTAYIPTSMYVTKKGLTASFKIKDRAVLDRCDDLIREYRKRVDAFCLELNDVPLATIVARLREKDGGGKGSFSAYASEWFCRAKIKGVKNYQTAFSSLKRFLGKDDVLFSDVTANVMRAFEDSLADRPRARSLYTNCIVRMFNDARERLNDEDYGIVVIRHSLRKYKAPKQNIAEKRALELRDIVRLMRLPPTGGRTHCGHPCRRDTARDCFLLSFFLMGMNTADLYEAKDFDGDCISYQRVKTRDRRPDRALIRVRVHPCVRPLVEKYRGGDGHVFCFAARYATASDFNRAVNLGLKDVGSELGIPSLQFYAARHSMATIAVNEAGVSKYVLNDMLNHVEPSMRVTDLYIKKDFTAINEANFRLIDYVLAKAGQEGETALISSPASSPATPR